MLVLALAELEEHWGTAWGPFQTKSSIMAITPGLCRGVERGLWARLQMQIKSLYSLMTGFFSIALTCRLANWPPQHDVGLPSSKSPLYFNFSAAGLLRLFLHLCGRHHCGLIRLLNWRWCTSQFQSNFQSDSVCGLISSSFYPSLSSWPSTGGDTRGSAPSCQYVVPFCFTATPIIMGPKA